MLSGSFLTVISCPYVYLRDIPTALIYCRPCRLRSRRKVESISRYCNSHQTIRAVLERLHCPCCCPPFQSNKTENEQDMDRMVVKPPPIISITDNKSQTLSSKTLRMLRRIEPLTSITAILAINFNTSSVMGINCIKGSSGLRINKKCEQPLKREARNTVSEVCFVFFSLTPWLFSFYFPTLPLS